MDRRTGVLRSLSPRRVVRAMAGAWPICLLATVAVVAGGRNLAAADGPRRIAPSYTAAQAASGAALYAKSCASCHGANLDDGQFGPPLRGDVFLSQWSGKGLDQLFDHALTRMPPAAPGSIPPEQMAEITAFILKRNNIVEGARPLPNEPTALAGIVIPPPTSVIGQLAAGVELPPPPDPPSRALQDFTPVTAAMLANPPPGDWLSYRRTPDAKGFSPLAGINKANVGRLKAAWAWALPNGANESTPLIHDGVLFIYGYGDIVQALDGATGDLLWQYTRRLPAGLESERKKALALYGDRLFLVTADNHVVALDVRTGAVVWDHALGLVTGREGYAIHGGPMVADGKVIFGTSGHAPGGNLIIAVDAATGQEAWRFATIPSPGRPGGDTWNNLPQDKRTGGSVWNVGSFDPELHLVFFGPSATYDTKPMRDLVSPTANNDALFTNTTLALDSRTGRLVWAFPHFKNDQWDLDWAFERQVLDMTIDGKSRKVVVTGGKIGLFDVVDARTGAYVSSFDLGLQNLVLGIDPETGGKRLDLTKAPGDGEVKSFCPHSGGGKNWLANAYDPGAGLMFIPFAETCAQLVPTTQGEFQIMTSGV
ncbi:MAG: hypothetical protein JWO33_691, partial [Caulobacteraceae bacterium]|nr:hypothetical protein [Caulobacteraceae bacterium]